MVVGFASEAAAAMRAVYIMPGIMMGVLGRVIVGSLGSQQSGRVNLRRVSYSLLGSLFRRSRFRDGGGGGCGGSGEPHEFSRGVEFPVLRA